MTTRRNARRARHRGFVGGWEAALSEVLRHMCQNDDKPLVEHYMFVKSLKDKWKEWIDIEEESNGSI